MQNDFNQILVFADAETQYSDVYSLTSEINVVDLEAEVVAIAADSGETMDVTVQFSKDQVTWVDEQSLAQMVAAGTKSRVVDARHTYMRFKCVLGGTNPTATVRLYAQGKEEGVSSSVPLVTNVTLTLANTEYSQALPNNTEKVLVKARASGEIKFAFVETESGINYVTIPAGSGGLWIPAENFIDLTLYMQSSSAGEIVEMLVVTK